MAIMTALLAIVITLRFLSKAYFFKYTSAKCTDKYLCCSLLWINEETRENLMKRDVCVSCHGLITGYGFHNHSLPWFQLLVVVEVVTSFVLDLWFGAKSQCVRAPPRGLKRYYRPWVSKDELKNILWPCLIWLMQVKYTQWKCDYQ